MRFETLLDPQADARPAEPRYYQWPYVEGLRLDEAMNDLAILATGLYGKPTLPQNGAPIRLVVPWKYGFKSIKSIVKIDLVTEQPTSLWMAAAPNEYGFYANVNPAVEHPRWSQASERRIGETGRRKTLPFNGYAEQVAGLYAGMDLATYYSMHQASTRVTARLIRPLPACWCTCRTAPVGLVAVRRADEQSDGQPDPGGRAADRPVRARSC